MGTRRSRHNKGRKPLYKEHGGAFISNNAILAANESDAANLLKEDREEAYSTCKKCGANKFPGSIGVCRSCYTSGSAFMTSPAAKALTPEAIEPLSEWAARELFKQLRWPETDGEPICPECAHGVSYHITRDTGRHLFKCQRCGYSYSLTSGTPFRATKLTWKQVLMTIVAINDVNNGSSWGKVLEAHVGYGKKSSCTARKKLRSFMFAERDARAHNYEIGQNRYVGGAWMSTRTWWTQSEKTALERFCENNANVELAANALGRSPQSIVRYALDKGFQPSYTWRQILPQPKKVLRLHNHAGAELLQFPYIAKVRDEHADLLEANSLIPKSIPPHMRSDIVQEIMLAMLEGRVTIAELKAKQTNVRWFVTKFYRENFEQAGHALSLTAENDGDEYDRLEASISQDEWRVEQMNEKRRAWDAIDHRFYPPSQVDDVYHHQVRDEQRRLHMKDDQYVDYFDAEEILQNLDPKQLRHLDDGTLHNHARLEERYGIKWTTAVNREMRAAVSEGRVSGVKSAHKGDDHGYAFEGWIRVRGKNVRIVFDAEKATLMTVLPPTDEGRPKTYREKVMALAEAAFK